LRHGAWANKRTCIYGVKSTVGEHLDVIDFFLCWDKILESLPSISWTLYNGDMGHSVCNWVLSEVTKNEAFYAPLLALRKGNLSKLVPNRHQHRAFLWHPYL